jgi:hypothetical protein
MFVPPNLSTGRWSPEVRGRRDAVAADDNTPSTEDICGAVFRLSDNYKSFIAIECKHGAATGDYFKSRQDSWSEISVIGVAGGKRFTLIIYPRASTAIPPWRADVYQRWEDGGQSTLATLTITLKVNGATRTVDAPADMPLLWVLRDELDLKGALNIREPTCWMALFKCCY